MNKNHFLTLSMGITTTIVSCTSPESNDAKQEAIVQDEAKKPNILIILADDMGYSDLGCMGSEINTPHLDKLAEQGILMTRFYNTGRCCPSRASLLTGMYSHQTGIGDMTRDDGIPGYRGALSDKHQTIAEVLNENGYGTYISGKWHVGSKKEDWPLKRGFDRFFGFPKGGGIYFYPYRKDRQAILDSVPAPIDTATFYSTDAINQYAVQFIDEHVQQKPDTPFFLYVAHIAPHFPLQAHQSDIEKYRGKYRDGFEAIRNKRFQNLKKLGIIDENTTLSDPDDLVRNWNSLSDEEKDTFDLRMAVYAAQIECMDRGIGKIVEKLKELKQFENTAIFFLSDNGGTHEGLTNSSNSDEVEIGSRNSWSSVQRSWANVSNTPFRMYKHWVHEGGIRTPLIIHYPELITEHRKEQQIGHIIDLMPTCIDLAQARQNTIMRLIEGKSLMPLIKGDERVGHEVLCWEHEGNRAIRKDNMKAVLQYPQNKWQLYNIADDPTELNDLAVKYPDTLNNLVNLHNYWMRRVGAVPIDSIYRLREQRKNK